MGHWGSKQPSLSHEGQGEGGTGFPGPLEALAALVPAICREPFLFPLFIPCSQHPLESERGKRIVSIFRHRIEGWMKSGGFVRCHEVANSQLGKTSWVPAPMEPPPRVSKRALAVLSVEVLGSQLCAVAVQKAGTPFSRPQD